jgi:hypothetical protein
MRILLVEPDKILAKTYMEQLLLTGIDVTLARDGQTAVHEIDKLIPDVLVI